MRSEYDGVKFYSKDDRSVGVELQKAEPIFASLDASKDYNDVNELLELCACDAGVFSQLEHVPQDAVYYPLRR